MHKLLVLTIVCSNLNAIGPIKELPGNHGYSLWREKFIRSISTGVAIGTVTGGMSAVADKHVTYLCLPLTLIGSIAAHNLITESILENFDEDRVPHNKWIVRSMSCMSSWAVWYSIMKLFGFPNYRALKMYLIG
jgi:hypothetical protein